MNDKLKSNLKGKALYDMEKKLSEYEGEDRIISSTEMAEIIKNQPYSETVYETKIPSLDRILGGGVEEGELILVSGPTGNGKCLGKGTPVLMYNGTIKTVEKVRTGDLLMGDDSKPRKVLSTTKGKGTLYEVKQKKGMSYIVNESHLLSLRKTREHKFRYDNPKREKRPRKNNQGSIINVSVSDYLNSSKTFKHIHKGYSVPVNFSFKNVEVPPYILGIWLGDGHSSNTGLTTMDNLIKQEWERYGDSLGLRVRKEDTENNRASSYFLVGKKGKKNHFREKLRLLNVWKNKNIPSKYKVNSYHVRISILAGLIDTDGYSNGNGVTVFSNKNERLIDDVCYLAGSLGFGNTKQYKIIKGSKYFTVNIYGEVESIPCLLRYKVKSKRGIKNPTNRGVSLWKVGLGDYYGFEIDGNKRFLLGDFTVTHNSTLLMTVTKSLAELDDVQSVWFSFEITPRQFFRKFDFKPPLFYLPAKITSKHLEWLEERILEAKIKYHAKVVFIDHLHFLFNLSHMRNTSLEIGDLVSKIKDIAVTNNLVVFLIVHPEKRNRESTEDPHHDNIRDSGLIPQYCDTAMMIWRIPNDYEPGMRKKKIREINEGDNQAMLRITKNRREGTQGYVRLILRDGFFEELQPITSKEEYEQARNPKPSIEVNDLDFN